MKALILAGGAGTRLWPVSRKNKPKQVQPFIDNETLLQKTYNRVLQKFDKEDIYISTGKNLVNQTLEQIPNLNKNNLIVEPVRRDKAPAIGLAAQILYNRDPECSLATIWSDHFIEDVNEYSRILNTLEEAVEKNPNHTVLVGVSPTYPETGYGYIKVEEKMGEIGNDELYRVDEFVEKPDLEMAENYLKTSAYLWNPGIFAWKTKYLLNLYEKYLPEVHNRLQVIDKALGTDKQEVVIEKEFCAMPSVEIENAILEKISDILVLPASFGWADIGHWKTIQEILAKNNMDNVVKGTHVSVDSSGNLIYGYSDKLIATAGVKNMIIIETEDTILICPKDNAQDVKKIVKKLEAEGMDKYL